VRSNAIDVIIVDNRHRERGLQVCVCRYRRQWRQLARLKRQIAHPFLFFALPNSSCEANVPGESSLPTNTNELVELWIITMPRRAERYLCFVLGGKPRSTNNPTSELADDFQSGTEARRQTVTLDQCPVQA
jgi:hypothetical protein